MERVCLHTAEMLLLVNKMAVISVCTVIYLFSTLSTSTYLIFAQLVTERKDEVIEADSVESKWNAMKEPAWQKATEQVLYVGGQKGQ